MSDTVHLMELLSWALPPIIGALIGYITNDIAIKMLFRPLRPYYIGRLRIPFTPGIIPRQREKLAESIGVMVSRELITEDAIRRQIAGEAFRNNLNRKIGELTALILETPLNRLVSVLSSRKEEKKKDLELPADTMLIQDVLSSFFRSEAFFNGLESSISLAMVSFLQVRIEVLAGKDGERLFDFLSSNIHLDGLREPVKKISGDLVIEGIRSKTGLDKLLGPQTIDGILHALNRMYPALAGELLSFLKTPHIHATLERRGRTVLRKLISRMNSLQRLFIVAGQYDRNLEEQMEEIVDDVLLQLEQAVADEQTRDKIFETLRSWLLRLSTRSVADVASIWGETLPDDVRRGVDSLFDILETSKVREGARSLLIRSIARYGETRIGELLGAMTGAGSEELCRNIAVWIAGLIKKVENEAGTTLHFFQQLLSALSEEGARSASEILRLEDGHRERINAALYRLVLGVIDTQVPSILESVDVNTLVVQKINSLDIEKVEELILIVIRTHLRWIILFGALLGFSIGAVQVVLTKLL